MTELVKVSIALDKMQRLAVIALSRNLGISFARLCRLAIGDFLNSKKGGKLVMREKPLSNIDVEGAKKTDW